MTTNGQTGMFGILTWLKEHQSVVSGSLDELAEQFGENRDDMRNQLQWLQRYECVKRAGRANEQWSITDQGRVRLEAGRFSLSGAFLSHFDSTGSSSEKIPTPDRDVTLITVPLTSESRLPDVDEAAFSPSPAVVAIDGLIPTRRRISLATQWETPRSTSNQCGF